MQQQPDGLDAIPRFVKGKEIARIYNVTPACVGSWAKHGKIPCIRFEKTVRYNLQEVREIIERRQR